MFFELGSKRIEKKKNLFKEIIFNNNLLYNNIVNKILSLTTNEYSNIKTYLKSQVVDYYKKINGYDYNDKEYDDANNHVNEEVYTWLIKHITQYYNEIIKYEQIDTMWDLVGLFIECCSLFTDGLVTDIGALYCDYSCYDPKTKVELIKPIPTFIKLDDTINQDVLITIENTKTKKDTSDIIIIEFAVSPVGEQDSVFCEIIAGILNVLFSIICKKFCDKSMLFNDKYYVINEYGLRYESNDGQIFIPISLNQYTDETTDETTDEV